MSILITRPVLSGNNYAFIYKASAYLEKIMDATISG